MTKQTKEGKTMKVQFTCNAVRWFDKINGNTYHSVRVTRNEDGAQLIHHMTYGYDEHYRQTALSIMLKAGWLPEKYNAENVYLYERENEYPIVWNVSDGRKKDCINNTR